MKLIAGCFAKGFRLLLLLIIIVTTGNSNALAVKFLKKSKDGAMLFKCEKSCGKVKIIKAGKNRYRVYSIPFSGVLEASSPTAAAEAACKESRTPVKSQNSPSPSRDIPQC